jgi:hypothetical protein
MSPEPSIFNTPRVHKGVHRHELRMVRLTPAPSGAYRARKRLPRDVGEGALQPRWVRSHVGTGGKGAQLAFKTHPHMLRHACG